MTARSIDLHARWLAQWDAMGPHRTGSPGEAQSATWLAALADEAGLQTEIQSYPFQRATPLRCQVTWDDRTIAGYPMLDGGTTAPGGIEGRLALPGTEGEIGLIEVSPNGEYDAAFQQARSGQHRALVAITRGGLPGLALVNAARSADPWGPPVLLVASTDGPALQAAARAATRVSLHVGYERQAAQAANVVARLPGGPIGEAPPLAVLTPRSGWWHSTSERGGGLIAWLAVARALAGVGRSRPVVMTANSGHEIGHLGMQAFDTRHPGLLSGAHGWLHLGASLGARGSALVIQSSQPDWLVMARDVMQAQGLRVAREVPPGQRPVGEARNIFDRQGRYLSLLAAAGPAFHHPDDRFPGTVDIDQVDAIARACQDIALNLVA